MTLTDITTEFIGNEIQAFEQYGGVLKIKAFKITGVADEAQAHYLTALNTLQLIAKDIDDYFDALNLGAERDKYFKVVVDEDFSNTGQAINISKFFGPYFDAQQKRPVVRGDLIVWNGGVGTYMGSFYYDAEEKPENVITSDEVYWREVYKHDYATKGFTEVFFEPPHSFGGKMTKYERGMFFLEFTTKLFDDYERIKVYEWGTDCSNFFDDGKEFWGSYLWTVYNPVKDIYIGIAASTTD